jgi:hypothetical protein
VEQRLSAIGELIEPDSERILEQCGAHKATAGRNYLPFLTRFYSHQRAALYTLMRASAIAAQAHRNKSSRHHMFEIGADTGDPPASTSILAF